MHLECIEHETKISTLDDVRLPPKWSLCSQTTNIYMSCSLNPSIWNYLSCCSWYILRRKVKGRNHAQKQNGSKIHWPIGTIQSLSLYAACNSKLSSVSRIASHLDVFPWWMGPKMLLKSSNMRFVDRSPWTEWTWNWAVIQAVLHLQEN